MDIFKKYQPQVSIMIVILSIIWIGFTSYESFHRDPSILNSPQVGFLAPNFELKDLQGNTQKLSNYTGKPIMINFWASWCKPCQVEMPAIQNSFQEHYPNIIFLSVNSTKQDSISAVSEFVKNKQLDFPVLLDIQNAVGSLYRIQALPTTYFINSKGVIQEIIIGGPMSETLLEIRLQNILEENDVSNN
ncbi:MAG: TlpA family protein disulfide reductase [Anaerolineaceae bacterium]